MPLKVGDTVWYFDSNTLLRDSQGVVIYREKWHAVTITGDTPQSWLLDNEFKVNKKTFEIRNARYGIRSRIAVDQSEVDMDVWKNGHQWRLMEHIQRTALTPTQLHAIARIVDYEPLPPIKTTFDQP